MSNHREMEHADGSELLQIAVVDGLNGDGEGFLIRIPASSSGKDLLILIALRIPQKPGGHISLQHESKKLSLRKSKAFMERLQSAMSTSRLICWPLGNSCLKSLFGEFEASLWMTKKLFWKELPELMESET